MQRALSLWERPNVLGESELIKIKYGAPFCAASMPRNKEALIWNGQIQVFITSISKRALEGVRGRLCWRAKRNLDVELVNGGPALAGWGLINHHRVVFCSRSNSQLLLLSLPPVVHPLSVWETSESDAGLECFGSIASFCLCSSDRVCKGERKGGALPMPGFCLLKSSNPFATPASVKEEAKGSVRRTHSL